MTGRRIVRELCALARAYPFVVKYIPLLHLSRVMLVPSHFFAVTAPEADPSYGRASFGQTDRRAGRLTDRVRFLLVGDRIFSNRSALISVLYAHSSGCVRGSHDS